MEMAAVATETNDLDQLSKMIIDMKQNLQSEKEDINIVDARNEDIIESIKDIYNEDGGNKIDEEGFRQAVLNGTVPTSIANTGA